jgi:penicillin-binding protein 1C
VLGAGQRLPRSNVGRIAITLVVLAGVIAWWMRPQPPFNAPVSAILLDRNGALLGAHIAADGQWRFPEIDAVPPRFATALIAYEDKRYYRHRGVDALAMARAVRSNWRADKIVSGASTLTMQLARMAYVAEGRKVRRSYGRKLRELVLALRLEARYSKQKLLALYVSNAPFGGNVVGLAAASWRYFGRPAEQLSWSEAATLAVLPNAPGLITPGRNRQRLQQRRDQLLQQLSARGHLSALELQLSLAEPLVSQPLALPDLAPHLLETLRRRFPTQHTFVSTLDEALQRQATQIVEQQSAQLQINGIGNAAAVVVDNRSLEVLAYVGNSGWSMTGSRALAVDVIQRPRSTGSILKPFLYAAMLDSGQLLPRMLVPDIPTQFQAFTPENFDKQFRGAVPADEALAQSLNVPAVRLLREYGYPRFHELLQRLGFTSFTKPSDHYGLALILGGAEASLWDVAKAYANLADGARVAQVESLPQGARELQWLLAPNDVSKAGGKKSHAIPKPRALSIGASWITQQALLEVKRPAEEQHWRNFANQQFIAWKTGTSWGLRDAWAVGSSTSHTVAVWAGNADGVGVPGLTGSTAAAPILFAIHDRLPRSPWYDLPVGALKQIETCVDDGYLATDLCEAIPQWVPAQSHFDRVSPYHQLLHLDSAGRYRVAADCASVASMQHQAWFLLPPALEFYYRRQHADYRPSPSWHPACAAVAAASGANQSMEFMYPGASGKIYLPVELSGGKGRAVFEIVHRDPKATVYWHIDDSFVGRTEFVHQLALDITPGKHQVTVVDQAGNRLVRKLDVLDRPEGYTEEPKRN